MPLIVGNHVHEPDAGLTGVGARSGWTLRVWHEDSGGADELHGVRGDGHTGAGRPMVLQLRSVRMSPHAEPDTVEPDSEMYFTTHVCTGCGAGVDGLHGRWTCGACGTCSPYTPPPEGWQHDEGYADW